MILSQLQTRIKAHKKLPSGQSVTGRRAIQLLAVA